MEKNIVGLDIGPNSIGWAVVEAELSGESQDLEYKGLIGAGSRIIPMGQDELGDFEKGALKSKASERTGYRGARRRYERRSLRRQRLNRVLNLLGFLPEHYAAALDRYGNLPVGCEERIAWAPGPDGRPHFLFQSSFDEMAAEFQARYPGMRVPYDWTIYYLRKKALREAITPQELAWVLHSFNAKRGYYQLRGKDEADADEEKKKKEVKTLEKATVVSIEQSDSAKGGRYWWNYHLSNGMIYKRTSERPMEWLGSERYFIVTTKLDADGNPKKRKDGTTDKSISAPNADDWGLMKLKTESEIGESGKQLGEFIYDKILADPTAKIIGGEVTVVDRRFYRDELRAILNKQREYIAALCDRELYAECIEALYPSNEAYRNIIAGKDFSYLIADDVILYQRPLKSKKYLISDCPYETVTYTDKSGNETTKRLKCVPRSHPLFQEFRVWQFIANLRIYQKERVEGGRKLIDADVTDLLLKNDADRVALFEWLNARADVVQDDLLKFLVAEARMRPVSEQSADFGELLVMAHGAKAKKDKAYTAFKWNYVEDKKYPCNKTHSLILSKLSSENEREALTPEIEEMIWHALYSITDKREFDKAFSPNARHPERGLYATLSSHFSPESIREISKIILKESDYGSYSRRALSRLLPLMRCGALWSAEAIDTATRARIDKIIDGEWDEGIDTRTRNLMAGMSTVEQFRGMATWQACYVVYGRHSEASEVMRWNSPDDLRAFITSFPHNSLRNPTVERIILETLRIVEEIWRHYGHIDEIHVELARSVKQNKEQRERAMTQMGENERRNLRLRAMLEAFLNDRDPIGFDPDANINPGSPNQQMKLRLFEDTAFNYAQANGDGQVEEMLNIRNSITGGSDEKSATPAQIRRYALWLEQNFRSPYTGATISLARLFTDDYQVDHIIPQALYWDDSFNNKVLCEGGVNNTKSNALAFDFIAAHQGETIALPNGRKVTILSMDEYQELVLATYKNNRAKCEKLLMKEIPAEFTQRQLNDTRYISKVVKSLLSNVVRERDEEGNLEAEAISKNVIVPVGAMTDRLKQDWGLKDVWNQLMLPRFRALNDKMAPYRFTKITRRGHEIPAMPLELAKGLSKKRIDHRHHAMDAIAIACTTRRHIQYINGDAGEAEADKSKYIDKQRVIDARRTIRNKIAHRLDGDGKPIFDKPWTTFTEDVKRALENLIVSFKQTNKVISHTSNKSQRYVDGQKRFVRQTKGEQIAIRKPLHKETVSALVNLREVKEVTLKEAVTTVPTIVDKELRAKIVELIAKGYDEKRMKAYFEEHNDEWTDVNPARKKVKVYRFSEESGSNHYYATRVALDTTFDAKKIRTITDTGIQKILLRYLEAKGSAAVAFTPEGIDELNANIARYNGGRQHQPIVKVRTYVNGDRYAIGTVGNKSKKYVVAQSGTLLYYFAFAHTEYDKKRKEEVTLRVFSAIPLRDVISAMKADRDNWEDCVAASLKERGIIPADARFLFKLSPGDMIYLPDAHETIAPSAIDRSKVYKVVSFYGLNGEEFCVIPYYVAKAIIDKVEYTTKNKIKLIGELKQRIIPLTVDRLGNITWVYDPAGEK